MQGFIEHAVSVTNEWSMAMVTGVVILSFYPDFRRFKFMDFAIRDSRVEPEGLLAILNSLLCLRVIIS